MIYTYNECIKKYGSDYGLKQQIEKGEITKLEKGWYSDSKYFFDKELISHKYPEAIFTGRSAFYYHGLTDEIPDNYFVVTKRDSIRISDKKIKQSYSVDKLFELGETKLNIDGSQIRIYDKERMLIELIRFRSKIPFDYYKEIIRNYRKEIDELSVAKIIKYLEEFKNGEKILKIIQLEVL